MSAAAAQAKRAREDVALGEALFERDLARESQRRLEMEIRRLERRLAEADSERASLRNRLDERERYLNAILGSKPWQVVQMLRGLVGRRW